MQRQHLISNRWIQLVTLSGLALLVYVMGSIHILDNQSREAALSHTPLVLLINTAILLFFAQTRLFGKTLVIFTFITVSSFIIEAIGVNTGFIFGNYLYGENFGIKIFSTPLLIGINWLFLVYACASVARQITGNKGLQPILAALLMVGYDSILEWAAPKMGLWTWHDSHPPFQNFLSWFIIALFYQWLLKKYNIETQNRMAAPLLILQISLFILVILFVH